MAYIIAICGGGGKTTLAFNKANEYKNSGKKVAVMTTTHMWFEDILSDIDDIKKEKDIKSNKVYFIGKRIGDKISVIDKEDYDFVCKNFDIVIIEADGSRGMPLKIPRLISEPVIPNNVSEIIVVYGLQSLNRKLGAVCHRFDELSYKLKELKNKNINKNTYVDKDLMIDFYNKFYEIPLKEKFKNAKISLYLSDMTKEKNYEKYKNINFVLCASGLSKRFGSNKLLTKINNKEMYKYTLEHIIEARKLLKDRFKLNYNHEININILCVSKYKEILENTDYNDIIYIENTNADLGLSQSLKLSLKYDLNTDAICYFNADIPYLSSKETEMMVFYFCCSNKNMAAMVTDKPTNPAIFNKEYYNDILNLDGDTGLRDIIRNNSKDLFKYYIDKSELKDIDTREDLLTEGNNV